MATVSVGDGLLTISVRDRVAEAELLSVTSTVNVYEPEALGAPLMVPMEMAIPAGSVPDANDQVYPPLPPVAASPARYQVPTTPAGSQVVVTVSGAPLTVRVSHWVAAELPAVTSTQNL